MKNNIHRARIITALFAVIALVGAAPAFSSIEDNIKKSFQVEPGGNLVLETDIGAIKVWSGESNAVEVEVVRKVRTTSSRRQKRVLKDFEINFRQEGNTVYIEADYDRDDFLRFWDFFFSRRLQVEFLISVPKKFNVDLKTSGGSIAVDDLEGEVRSRTSGGSLNFKNIQGPLLGKTSGGSIKLLSCIGNAEVRTSGGSITIGEVDGDIIAHTSGGRVEIGRAKGRVDAHTSGGSIQVKEVMGAIKASSSGGSVEATISGQPSSDCRLTTSGGSVTVFMAEDIQVDVNARTSGGRVHTEFPVTIQGEISRSSLYAKINGGGPELYLHTSGGSIYIRKM